MQAGGALYGGARVAGAPRAPPSARERKLMDVLLRAREEHVTTVLKCVGGWPFEEQANLDNWRAVLDRLDALLRRALRRSPRLVLVAPALAERDAVKEEEAATEADDEAARTEQVYEVLRFTAVLLENASNKAAYGSIELVAAFLSARNERVAFEATHVAAMLALPPALHRFTIDPTGFLEASAGRSALLRRRLLAIAQGHGSLNSSLDVVDFLNASSSSAPQEQSSFQFYGQEAGSRAELVAVPIPPLPDNAQTLGEDSERGSDGLFADTAYAAANTFERLSTEFNVPKKLHFQLYTKIRACYASRSKLTREAIVVERLYALLALFSSFGESSDVINYIEQNPELTRGIVELIRVEICEKIPIRVRTSALLVLTALVNDRVGRAGGMGVLGRQSNVLSALGVVKGAPHGVFPSLVRFCMSELESATTKTGGSRRNSATAGSTADVSGAAPTARTSSEADNDMDMSLAVAFVQATTDLLSPEEAEVVGGPAFRNPTGSPTEAKLCWVEAVLQLLSAVVAVQSGAAVLTENGIVPALLHTITMPSVNAFHTTIITQCVQGLEITVSSHSAAANLYKDLNGVGILTDRLVAECSTVSTTASSTTAPKAQLPEAKGSLVISILAALSMSFHSQGVMSAGATSRVIRDGSALSKVLLKILGNVDTFGPAVFAQASVVVSDVINNDPSSVNHVHSSGIADAFLKTTTRWTIEDLYPSDILLPGSSDLIIAVPTVLNALSLTANHAEKVAKYEPLMHLLDMFALPQYAEEESSDCLQGDVASVVGAGIFELMRHVPSTQNSAVQASVHAVRKIIRFGEEKVRPEQASLSPVAADSAGERDYGTLLRMTTHLAELLEPMLSKSEHASYFADLGGVQALLRLYQLILPSTTSFLSSGLPQSTAGAAAASNDRSSNALRHHPAAQAITLALRSYASQQPTNLLTAVVKEIGTQLDQLRAARAKIGLPWYLSESGEGAEGILSSLPDIELANLFNPSDEVPAQGSTTKADAERVALTGDYLRVLAMIEWLCSVLIWTLDTAHGHLQNRRWFIEFASKTTQLVLARLFSVDRSVQFERASLAAQHQKAKRQQESSVPDSKTDPELAKAKGAALWKVGSLLLLRFAIVSRSLLSAYGKAFLSATLQHRRSEDVTAPLAPHARALAKTVALTLERHLLYVISESRANQIDAFVQQYYLSFLLETITIVVFEGKKKQVNTLVLLELLKPLSDTSEGSKSKQPQVSGTISEDVTMTGGDHDENPPDSQSVVATCTGSTFTASNLMGIIMNIVQRFFALSFESPASETGKLSLSNMSSASFRIAAGLLSRISNLDVISASPMTAALVADEEINRSTEGDKFDPKKLSVDIHRHCVRTFLSVWTHPNFSGLPVEFCVTDVLPVAVTLLKNRIDQNGSISDGVERAGGRLSALDFYRRGGEEGTADIFGEALNLRRTLFGGGGSRPTPRRTTGGRQEFVVDSSIVDNLVSMGFTRPRVERALRRIQVNDVELAMEWILEHEEEDESGDEQDSSNVDAGGEASSSATEEDLEQKRDEDELQELYGKLRGSFETTCFQILQSQAASELSASSAATDATKKLYSGHKLVKTIAEHFSYLVSQSDAENEAVIAKLNEAILKCFGDSATMPNDDGLLTMLVHLLALLLRLNPDSREAFQKQSPSSVDKLLAMLSSTQTSSSVELSFAPILLVMDALVSIRARLSQSSKSAEAVLNASVDDEEKMEDEEKTSGDASSPPDFSTGFERRLVDTCLELLKRSFSPSAPVILSPATVHAIWQLLAHVTLDYELASHFYASGGVDVILGISDASSFSGYHELTCALLSHVLESPDVLEQMMKDKILRAISKLAARFGSPRQMRITPRALLMEVATVAARNEDVFVKALEHSVQVKKTESGRTYVVPIPESVESRTAESGTPSAGASSPGASLQPSDEDMTGAKKPYHRLPKDYKHNAQVIVHKIIDKIRALWATEKDASLESEKVEVESTTVVCIGMYLRLLVHLVAQFPVCASILAKAKYSVQTRELFVHVVLQDFLPCPELCNFAAVRRALKDGGVYGGSGDSGNETDSIMSEVGCFVGNRTRSRVQNAHRLLVGVGSQSGEGSKTIILEVVHLLQQWPRRVSATDAAAVTLSSEDDGDLSVRDEAALSALHAWAGLIMSILWPKGSSKGFALDKVVLGGGLKGKHSFVTLLADALRKIDLEHPLAHATCSMLLRPLATLTRPFVTQRIRRLLKKRNAMSEGTVGEGGEDISMESPTPELGGDGLTHSGSDAPSELIRNIDIADRSPSRVVTEADERALVFHEDDDVAMRSPSSAADDRAHRNDVGSDDGHSGRSSDSGHSSDEGEGQEEEDDIDDEEEEDDDEDDDDDEDEDDDDDDDDDDDEEEEDEEEEERMRVRASRRGAGGHISSRRASSNRLWGSLDAELSVLDALDEVDEDEFSYLNMLDDEATFAEEQSRRARLASRQTAEGRSGRSDSGASDALTGATGVSRSLADALGLRGPSDTRGADSQTLVMTFGNDDGEEDGVQGRAELGGGSLRSQASSGELGESPNSMSASSLLQYIEELPDVGDELFFFDSLMDELPNPGRPRPDRNPSRMGADALGSNVHPLLRLDTSEDFLPERADLVRGGSDRIALPRHSSLLRELQELTEQVQNQMPMALGGVRGGRLSGRDQLARGGRGRPPSRNNRLSIVSNLLNEFSLNPLSNPRGNVLRMRRGERDNFGAPGRGFRRDGGGGGSGAMWGPSLPGADVDVRSVASRLEQRINDTLIETPRESPSAREAAPPGTTTSSAINVDESGPMSEGEDSAPPQDVAEGEEAHLATPQGSEHTASESSRNSMGANEYATSSEAATRSAAGGGNESSGDTASVTDLASTFGEYSLRSPGESDTDAQMTPVREAAAESSTQQHSQEHSGVAPPPAPAAASTSDQMMGFTLDLSSFGLPLPPSTSTTEAQREQPSRTTSDVINLAGEEESKTEDEAAIASEEQTTGDATPATGSSGYQCPEGMDPEVFDSLPPDVQAEIVGQVSPPPSTAAPRSDAGTAGGSEGMSQLELDMANSSFDRETLEALPPDIRAEVLENERREREAAAAAAAAPADVSRAQEMDNASFVASLAPELREEILVTCDDAFLQTLPSQVRAEAMVLRERAAFRTTYREPAIGGGPDLMTLPSDIFNRPSMRRTQTSAQGDGGAGGRRRRTYFEDMMGGRRGRREGDASGRHHHHHHSSSSHKGMLRVDKDEEEDEADRVCDDRCVKGLLRLLFMAQSVIQNRVLQRLLSNVCMYPLTRQSIRTNLLRVATLPLEAPLEPSVKLDDDFPPSHLYGCNASTNRQLAATSAKTVSSDVVNRMLHVLVSLAKYNPRFAVEMLQPHGMHRGPSVVKVTVDADEERGVAVLIDLLAIPVVNRNGTNLDTLLELLELVLSPLERLPKAATPASASEQEEQKEETSSDAAAAPAAAPADPSDSPAQEQQQQQQQHRHHDEWVKVPAVELDAKRMQEVVAVLGMDICTPQMQERTLGILKLLNHVSANRKLVVSAIVGLASELARVDRYRSGDATSSANAMLNYETSAVLLSAQDELKLLRLLHTLSDVCESTVEFAECCQTIGLDSLWDALSASLAEARSSGGLDEQDLAGGDSKEGVATTSGRMTTAEDDNADGMVIEGKSAGASCAMAALLARFLPMVEAFFVVNARDAASMKLSVPDSTEREEAVVAALQASGFESAEADLLGGGDGDGAAPGGSPRASGVRSLERASSTASTASEAGESMRLANFVEANRVLLNMLVREKPSLLDSSLAALIKMPRCRAYLDFDNKRSYFHSAMKKLRQSVLRSHGGSASVRIPVRREHIFEDSYYALRMRSGQELRRKLHISFTGEEGIDAGGVTREWYVILAREIFNPNYVLFTSAADSPTFQPNPLSYVNKDHLSYFEFVGKVIGKAVADGQLLDAHFTRSFYKHMLQLPLSYHDMEGIDPEYYRNLHSILDHPIADLGLELTFSAEQSNFGKTEVVDLIPNGRHVAVTDGNKMEYVKLVTHHRMATGIRQQIDAFLQGFHQLVPPEMIAIFNENELELLISGMPEIDIDDLKAHTEYANYKPTDAVIRWFWSVLYAFTQEERALFLQFVTGTSKVPLEGFKALEGMRGTQRFNIHKAFGNNKALPSAHTCFNQLDLPEYESEEKLKQCLLLAIREGSEGFGFG